MYAKGRSEIPSRAGREPVAEPLHEPMREPVADQAEAA